MVKRHVKSPENKLACWKLMMSKIHKVDEKLESIEWRSIEEFIRNFNDENIAVRCISVICLIIYVAGYKTTCWPLSYDLFKSYNI